MNRARGKRREMDGEPERVSIGSMRIKAGLASGFSVEVIESKLSRPSAVRSSAWLGLLRARHFSRV
jgi:hypothetical protein